MRAKDVMTRQAISVSPQNSVRHAVAIMVDSQVSGLTVLDDDGKLVGIVTEGDLMGRMELGADVSGASRDGNATLEASARTFVKGNAWSVADVMTQNIVRIDEEMPLNRIAALMIERGIKRCPVMHGENLVGIVSRADLLKAFADAVADEPVHGDAMIRRSVSTRLREAPGLEAFDAAGLDVRDGVVYLEGTVACESAKDAARVIAEGVRGVERVVDHLTVMQAAARPPGKVR